MKKILKFNLCILLFIIILINLGGCKKSETNENNLKKKVNTEISYIDSELVYVVNALNNINYSEYKVLTQEVESTTGSDKEGKSETSDAQTSEDKNAKESGKSSEQSGENNNSASSKEEGGSSSSSEKTFSMQANNILENQQEINWSELKNKIENLYTTWTVVSLDLKTIGVSEDELNRFTESLDIVTQAIKNEDREETLSSVLDLYEFLPKFIEVYSKNNKVKNLFDAKYNLLLCYKYADLENWEELEKSLNNLKMSFSNVVNKKEEYEGKEVNINSASVIINEMSNTVNSKDKDIFFIKYKNLIQELNIISSV